jgi:ABC-2 type transport system permease protein
MRQTLTIANRELSSLFFSPVAYVLMGIVGCLTTLLYVLVFFNSDKPATATDLFLVTYILLVFIVPAISMRLVSEELNRGTIETLMTAPVSDTQVVLGKYLGALGFLVSLLLWLALPLILLEKYGNPDYGPIFTGLLGLLLVGALYLAVGTFASSLTVSQVIAFMLAFFFIAPLVLLGVLSFIVARAPIGEGLRRAIFYLSIYSKFESFNNGVLTLANLIFFLSGIALFLFLAVKVVESRRWR